MHNCPESLVIRGKGKRGHGGICIFVSETIYSGIEIFEKIPQGLLWVKLKKDYSSMEAELFICFSYIPPKDSIYFKNVETDFLMC